MDGDPNLTESTHDHHHDTGDNDDLQVVEERPQNITINFDPIHRALSFARTSHFSPTLMGATQIRQRFKKIMMPPTHPPRRRVLERLPSTVSNTFDQELDTSVPMLDLKSKLETVETGNSFESDLNSSVPIFDLKVKASYAKASEEPQVQNNFEAELDESVPICDLEVVVQSHNQTLTDTDSSQSTEEEGYQSPYRFEDELVSKVQQLCLNGEEGVTDSASLMEELEFFTEPASYYNNFLNYGLQEPFDTGDTDSNVNGSQSASNWEQKPYFTPRSNDDTLTNFVNQNDWLKEALEPRSSRPPDNVDSSSKDLENLNTTNNSVEQDPDLNIPEAELEVTIPQETEPEEPSTSQETEVCPDTSVVESEDLPDSTEEQDSAPANNLMEQDSGFDTLDEDVTMASKDTPSSSDPKIPAVIEEEVVSKPSEQSLDSEQDFPVTSNLLRQMLEAVSPLSPTPTIAAISTPDQSCSNSRPKRNVIRNNKVSNQKPCDKEEMEYYQREGEMEVMRVILRIYKCKICLRSNFTSEQEFIKHFTDVHKISKNLTYRTEPYNGDEDIEGDVDRYEKMVGHPIPGRVHPEPKTPEKPVSTDQSESTESDSSWEDYDSEEDESLDDGQDDELQDPEYDPANSEEEDSEDERKRRRRASRAKASAKRKLYQTQEQGQPVVNFTSSSNSNDSFTPQQPNSVEMTEEVCVLNN